MLFVSASFVVSSKLPVINTLITLFCETYFNIDQSIVLFCFIDKMDRGIYDCNIQPPNSVLSGIKKFNVTSKYNNYCNNNYDSPSKYTKLSLYYT